MPVPPLCQTSGERVVHRLIEERRPTSAMHEGSKNRRGSIPDDLLPYGAR